MGVETFIKKIFLYFNTQCMQFVMNISVVQEKTVSSYFGVHS